MRDRVESGTPPAGGTSPQVEPAAVPLTEGVLEIPGEWILHHGGRLREARLAWRLSGPSDAPLVCALGGVYLFADDSEWVTGFSPEAFLVLSESLDLHRVDAGRIFVPTVAIAAREDQLVPLTDVRGLGARLGNARVHEISSIYGHDAYLRESEPLRRALAGLG